MPKIFTIEMLPAEDGDCLLIEYGEANTPHRILVDGGRGNTADCLLKYIDDLPTSRVHFELIVITHIDNDHIDGILKLLEMNDPPFTVGDIWFNGWRHLEESDLEEFGPVAGEKLTKCIIDKRFPWNNAFHGKAAVVDERPLPPPLAGGMQITLLSPTRQKLLELKPVWAYECKRNGLDPSQLIFDDIPFGLERMGVNDIETLATLPFRPDTSKANGSSIAFMAEYNGKRIILSGDAHSNILSASLKALSLEAQGKINVDILKVSHHGSSANFNSDIFEQINCSRFLISTNGKHHQHPDPETIARIIQFSTKPTLFFNYRTSYTECWDKPQKMEAYNYRVSFLDESPGSNALAI